MCCQRETARLRCQRNVGPGEAGCSQQTHQNMNFSCRDRVNSGCAKPITFPSKTSCTYQRFSGNCIKPRRTRDSIPHEKPGPQEQMGFITVLLSAPDRVDFSTPTGHGWSTSYLFQTWQGFQPVFANILADKCCCTLSTGSSKGRGCILGITIL